MTRKPCLTRKAIQPGSRQLYLTLEAKPWISSTGSARPSLGPSSMKAMRTPPEEKVCMALSYFECVRSWSREFVSRSHDVTVSQSQEPIDAGICRHL